MTAPNWANRTLFHGDNLGFLRAMNSESVDLIATDPPFNKGRDFHATPDSLAAGAKFQDRWSWERDVHQEWVDEIADDHPNVMTAIQSARTSYGDDMGAFLCFMAVRLLAMHRVLKPTGSIYLHCDPTASHYLKQLMDAVFGRKNFGSSITWKRSLGSKVARRWYSDSDHILFYGRGERTWNPQYRPLTDEIADRWYRYRDEDGRRYNVDNLKGPSSGYTYEFLGVTRVWRYPEHRMLDLVRQGRIVHKTLTPGSSRNVAGYKRYLDESKGATIGDVWTDIGPLNRGAKERAGYPTQKPLALYERMILASSNEGDVVLDPFAGCATTLVAAEKLQRQWVGMDIWEGAHRLVEQRLQDTAGLFGEVTFTATPPTRTDDGDTAAPFLRVKQRVREPDGPRWTRAAMYAHLLDQHGPVCQGCDRSFDDPRYLELDHNVPRSDGGINHVTNRILLCGPCNRLKSNIYTLSGLRRENNKRGYMP